MTSKYPDEEWKIEDHSEGGLTNTKRAGWEDKMSQWLMNHLYPDILKSSTNRQKMDIDNFLEMKFSTWNRSLHLSWEPTENGVSVLAKIKVGWTDERQEPGESVKGKISKI